MYSKLYSLLKGTTAMQQSKPNGQMYNYLT